MTLLNMYPVILGAEYIHVHDGTVATLQSCDLKKDFIRLTLNDSPWIFESNHSTFSFYWKLK
jgi:hypothetical protein